MRRASNETESGDDVSRPGFSPGISIVFRSTTTERVRVMCSAVDSCRFTTSGRYCRGSEHHQAACAVAPSVTSPRCELIADNCATHCSHPFCCS